ncbi:MAG: hypothetical protein KAV87_51610 [Desulfobacteraceae bacterium]|nr:hypothetical protein [Desulfobacteraceae bacterium]
MKLVKGMAFVIDCFRNPDKLQGMQEFLFLCSDYLVHLEKESAVRDLNEWESKFFEIGKKFAGELNELIGGKTDGQGTEGNGGSEDGQEIKEAQG